MEKSDKVDDDDHWLFQPLQSTVAAKKTKKKKKSKKAKVADAEAPKSLKREGSIRNFLRKISHRGSSSPRYFLSTRE